MRPLPIPRLSAAAAAALTLTLSAAPPALAEAPRYTAIDLGPGPNSVAGMNAAGDFTVTGIASGEAPNRFHPLLYSGGGVTDLYVTAGAYGTAHGLNNTGTVVGAVHPNGGVAGPYHAARWTSAGVTVLGRLSPDVASEAFAVNDSGLIVGHSLTSTTGGRRAVSWTSGVIKDLGTLGGDTGSAFGVNNAGTIVGFATASTNANGDNPFRPAVWRNGSAAAEDLGTLGGRTGKALGINDAGWIVGGSNLPTGQNNSPGDYHATLWRDGAVLDLGAPGGARRSEAFSINAAGDILGTYWGIPGSPSVIERPFLYTGGVMYDFASLLDPALNITQLYVNSYAGINDAGWFAGAGMVNGEQHIFLFQPVPEPGAAGLAACAVTGGLLIRRRRRTSGAAR